MTTEVAPSLMGLLSRNWWLVLLRGVLAILFGIFALSRPGLTLAMLVLFFGVYALVDGVFSVCAAIGGSRHREARWLLLLEGLIGIGLGFLTLQAPGVTAVALLFFIAAWALATGVLKIIAAIRLRREMSGELWLILSGLAGVIFAFLVMDRPAAGALVMASVIGCFAIFTGVMLVLLSLKLHSLGKPGSRASVEEPPNLRAA